MYSRSGVLRKNIKTSASDEIRKYDKNVKPFGD